LIERSMKVHGWYRAEAKRIFDAYRQYLVLIKEHADWHGEKLIPCHSVDEMWHLHEQMDDYNFDMRNLLGHVVSLTTIMTSDDEDDVRRAVQEHELCSRLRATREAVKQRFGHEYDDDVWNNITVGFVDQLGVEFSFAEINRRQPLSYCFRVYATYAVEEEESVDKFHFAFDGKTINNEKGTNGKEVPTPMRLGIEHNGKIEVSHIEKVAITIHYSRDNSFLWDKTSPMFDPFDHFATNILDTKCSKLVFLFRKERVFGYESPTALGLKCRDNIIDVVDVESYRCENCVCCNPALLSRNANKDTTCKVTVATN